MCAGCSSEKVPAGFGSVDVKEISLRIAVHRGQEVGHWVTTLFRPPDCVDGGRGLEKSFPLLEMSWLGTQIRHELPAGQQ